MAEEHITPISDDVVNALLSTQRSSTKGDPTATRDLATWFRLNHLHREEGCQNPNCVDTRPLTDTGRKIVFMVKGQYCCRYCFLDGWLLDVEV